VDVNHLLALLCKCFRVMIGKPEEGLVHVENLALVAVKTVDERTRHSHDLGCLEIPLLGRSGCLVCPQVMWCLRKCKTALCSKLQRICRRCLQDIMLLAPLKDSLEQLFLDRIKLVERTSCNAPPNLLVRCHQHGNVQLFKEPQTLPQHLELLADSIMLALLTSHVTL